MAEKNTPLINELLCSVGNQLDDAWFPKGKLPAGLVQGLCDKLKTDTRFAEQPGRFYTSAVTLIEDIYKSYLRIQHQLRWQLEGQLHWLQILKSDEELTTLCGQSLDAIRQAAQNILDQAPPKGLRQQLFLDYEQPQSPLEQVAIAYLLKNGCRIPKRMETPKKFATRLQKAQRKVKNLERKVQAHFPQGRDWDDTRRIQLLTMLDETIAESDAEAKAWQSQLLRSSNSVPYSVNYGTNTDIRWGTDTTGRLTVGFNGLGKMTFQIFCDQRQLKWFNRFYEDYQIYKQSKNQHSSALFTLRSARLVWREKDGKGDPWNKNQLTLHCSLDTRYWTAEGTELIRQEKAEKTAKSLAKKQGKQDLTVGQKDRVKQEQSSLERLQAPYPRPSQKLYQGSPSVIVGVSMTLQSPATVVVVDVLTQKVLAQRSFQQLLGKNYHLFNRQQKQKQRLGHKRKEAQRKDQVIKEKESNLGEYIDRLLAKEIINVAIAYNAGSIALPVLSNIRSNLAAEIEARAERKIPGCIKAQEKYAEKYQTSIHQWSYKRLKEVIFAKASQHNIAIEEVEPPSHKKSNIMAKEIAFDAYQLRNAP